MSGNTTTHLYHMLEACNEILEFTANKTLEIYKENRMLRAAIERSLTVLGEAAWRIRREDPESFALIPEGPLMIGFRNVVVHGYDKLNDEMVWESVTLDIEPLKRRLEALLKDR